MSSKTKIVALRIQYVTQKVWTVALSNVVLHQEGDYKRLVLQGEAHWLQTLDLSYVPRRALDSLGQQAFIFASILYPIRAHWYVMKCLNW